MIEGTSGTGKSSLALGLIEAALGRNLDARLICDDQALIEKHDKQLWVKAPKNLEGQVEIYGSGIATLPFVSPAKIDLVCNLVSQFNLPRFPDPLVCERWGVEIPFVNLPQNHERQAIRIVLHKLGLPLLPT